MRLKNKTNIKIHAFTHRMRVGVGVGVGVGVHVQLLLRISGVTGIEKIVILYMDIGLP
jgi:hypothetical protein